jgi:hypothetical protein
MLINISIPVGLGLISVVFILILMNNWDFPGPFIKLFIDQVRKTPKVRLMALFRADRVQNAGKPSLGAEWQCPQLGKNALLLKSGVHCKIPYCITHSTIL